jgi:serine/threonine protein kinase
MHIKEDGLTFGPKFKMYSSELRNLMTRMLLKDVDDRPTSTECLEDVWFAQLRSTPLFKRNEFVGYHETK